MNQYGSHTEIISFCADIKNMYTEFRCTVRIKDEFTEWFDILQGVQQGDVMIAPKFVSGQIPSRIPMV